MFIDVVFFSNISICNNFIIFHLILFDLYVEY